MRTFLWAAILIFSSCTGGTTPPKDIIDKVKMADILVEIHLAEAKVSKLDLKSMDSSVIVYRKLQQEIWTKHKVDSALYNKSYAYYASNPEQLGSVYEIVTKALAKTDSSATPKK